MISRRQRLPYALLIPMVLLGACGEEAVGPDPVPPPPPGTPTITINLLRLALAVGSNAQLSVAATDADGNVVANPSVSYSSSDDQVVTVDGTGLATSVAVGTATITATFSGVSDVVPVGIVSSAFFANDVAPIFNSNCAFSGCHVAPNPAQGMDLSSAQSYAALVDVRANQVSIDRVEPGDPDGSYVIHKLEGLNGVTQMPLNGTPLPQAAIDVVRAWIQDGAQNN